MLEGDRFEAIRKPSGIIPRTLQGRLDPYGVGNPSRQRGRCATNGCKFFQNVVGRPPVAAKPLAEQGPISTGGGLAPGGKAVGGNVRIGLLSWQSFEIVRKEFINGRRANDQALMEGIHQSSLRPG